MYELLEKVLKPYGPSGNEEAVARTIRQALEGHVDSIETDVMGNLIAIKKGTNPNGKKVMFSAHMDHIGFIVTGFEKEGFLRVTNVGGVSPDSNQFRHVTFGNGVQGVVVSQPLKPGESRAMKHMFIDIGAQDRAEAEKMVKLGDVAVYAPNVVRLGQYRVASPAMDDRSACAVLLQFLLQAGTYADTIIGVFSVQEEVGCRGAKTASFALAPDVGIALDVTAWGDTPEVDQPAIEEEQQRRQHDGLFPQGHLPRQEHYPQVTQAHHQRAGDNHRRLQAATHHVKAGGQAVHQEGIGQPVPGIKGIFRGKRRIFQRSNKAQMHGQVPIGALPHMV